MSNDQTAFSGYSLGGLFVRGVVVIAVLLVLRPMPQNIRYKAALRAGDAAAQAGRYENAQDHYLQLLNDYPGATSLIFERLVTSSLAAGAYADAQVYLYALADHDGWTPQRREQLHLTLERTGQDDLAQALLLAFPDQFQRDPAALRQVIQQQIARHLWDEAAITLTQWLAADPDNGEAAYWLGLLLAPTDWVEADRLLARAALDPVWAAQAATIREVLAQYDTLPLADAHALLGVQLIGINEWAFAERALQLALDRNSVNPAALAYLGFAQDQQGRDGWASIDAALAMSPNDPVLHYLAGLHWRQAGDHETALDFFERAYDLDPQNPALAVEVAVSLQQFGDLAGAEEWLRLAVLLGPEDVEWVRLLAAFYADTGFLIDTVGLLFIENAHAQFPDEPDIEVSLGWAYDRTNQLDRARSTLSSALVRDSANWRGRYYFALVQEQSGDLQGAVESYEAVVMALGPHDGFGLLAARALERLGG